MQFAYSCISQFSPKEPLFTKCNCARQLVNTFVLWIKSMISWGVCEHSICCVIMGGGGGGYTPIITNTRCLCLVKNSKVMKLTHFIC